MSDTTGQLPQNKALIGIGALMYAMSRSITLTGVIVLLGALYFYNGATWYGFNFLLSLPFAYLGLRWLNRRLSVGLGESKALAITFLAAFAGWVALDMIGGLIRPSQGLAALTGFFPLDTFYVLLEHLTGYRFFFGA